MKMTSTPQTWRVIITPQSCGISGQKIYLLQRIVDFFIPRNSGATWTKAQQGLFPLQNGPYLNTLAISGGNVVVSTFENGVWYRKLSDFIR